MIKKIIAVCLILIVSYSFSFADTGKSFILENIVIDSISTGTSTFTENFTSPYTNINLTSTNLTISTNSPHVLLPFASVFTDLTGTGTTPLSTIIGVTSINAIAYGTTPLLGSVFLLGGNANTNNGYKVNTIVTYNGSNFTNVNSLFYNMVYPSNINAIVFGNGFFLVGSSGPYLSKYNGQTPLTEVDQALNNFVSGDDIFAIGFNGSYWLIGGKNGKIDKWDGVTLTANSMTDVSSGVSGLDLGGGFGTNQVNAITWCGTYWLVGGANGCCATSTDGINWSGVAAITTFAQSATIYAIGWNGSSSLIGSDYPELGSYNGSTVTTLTGNYDALAGGYCGDPPSYDCQVQSIIWNGYSWVIGGRFTTITTYNGNGAVNSNFIPFGHNAYTGTNGVTLISSNMAYNNAGYTQAIGSLCFNGTYTLFGGSGGNGYTGLDQSNGFYNGSSTKSIYSNTINSDTTDRIYQVKLNNTDYAAGELLSYYITCDGGTNWQQVSKGITTSINYTGFNLIWRADMQGIWSTPTITGPLTVTYTNTLASIIPAGLGGVISASDPQTQITIAPGTSTSDLQITFSNPAVSYVSNKAPTTAIVAYNITSDNPDTGATITTFSAALNLVFHWQSSDGINVDKTNGTIKLANCTGQLSLAFWDGLHWVPESSTVTRNGTDIYVSAFIGHLSTYGIVAYSPTNTPLTAEPNPFTPTTANATFNNCKITFPNTTGGSADLKIWDRTATIMREITMVGVSSIVWDGRNSQGNIVRSGVYIFEVKVNGTSEGEGTVVVGR